MSKMIRNELKIILPGAFIADIVVYLSSFIFIGVNYSMALGLLLGTAIMITNFIMLGNASEAAIYRFTLDRDISRAKRKMAVSYIIRSIILAAALYASLVLKTVNTVGVLIPFLYVKPIYMLKSMISDKKGENKL